MSFRLGSIGILENLDGRHFRSKDEVAYKVERKQESQNNRPVWLCTSLAVKRGWKWGRSRIVGSMDM